MTTEEFLDKLEGVVSSGAGWKALCPAHDDREPSLSIGESEEGILVNCQAGCSTESVMQAMGLGLKDLFFHSTNYAKPIGQWSYTDEHGNELFQSLKYARGDGKTFRQRHLEDGEWVWDMKGVRRVLYRLPEIIAAVQAGRTIWVVEGEKDADAFWDRGYAATCNPMGAGKWREEYSDSLTGANVIIVQDRDASGRQHAERVRESLQSRAKGIWLVQPKSGKDASDHFEAGHAANEFTQVKERFRRGLVTAHDLAEQAMDDLDLRESDMPGYQPWEVLPLVYRAGRAYAIGAYTGDGKTSAALQAFRKLCTEGHRCGYFSLEMPERDLRNKLLQHRGIPLNVLEQPWTIRGGPYEQEFLNGVEELRGWDMDITFDSSISAEKIQEITLDREYDVVFVDHLHRFAWGSERRKLDEQVNRLTNLALEENIVLVVLCQLRKFTRGKDFVAYPRPTLQDFRETSMIGDDSSMALAIWRQRDNTGMNYTGTTEVIVLKNRYTTSGPEDQQGKIFLPHFDRTRSMFVPAPVFQDQPAGEWSGGDC